MFAINFFNFKTEETCLQVDCKKKNKNFYFFSLKVTEKRSQIRSWIRIPIH
jgi:hypothetical protein